MAGGENGLEPNGDYPESMVGMDGRHSGGDDDDARTNDPLRQLEREDQRFAVTLAFRWGLGVPALTLLTALILWVLTGDSVITHVAPIVVSFVGAVGICIVTSRRWSRYHAWAPLMGAVWALLPWFLLTATTLLPKLILGQ